MSSKQRPNLSGDGYTTMSDSSERVEQFSNRSFLLNAHEVMTNKNEAPAQSSVNTADEAPAANNSPAITASTGTASPSSSKT